MPIFTTSSSRFAGRLVMIVILSLLVLPFSNAESTQLKVKPVTNSVLTPPDAHKDYASKSLFGIGNTNERHTEDTAAFIVKMDEAIKYVEKVTESSANMKTQLEEADLRKLSQLDSELTFHIENTMPFNSSGDPFCVEARSFAEGAEIYMRACDRANHKQMWFIDYHGQLRLRFNDQMCLIWVGRHLKLSTQCKKHKLTKSEKSLKADTYRFNINEERNEIYAERNDSSEFTHLGVPRKNIRGEMKLFHSDPVNAQENQSLDKFAIKWILRETSQSPSQVPSQSINPTAAPSAVPSDSPSECIDEEGWTVGGTSKFQNMTCVQIEEYPEKWCDLLQGISDTQNLGKSVSEACCACHGSTFKTTYPSLAPTLKPSVSQLPSLHAYPSSEPSSQPSVCRDEPNWHFKTKKDDGTVVEVNCDWFGDNADLCEQFKDSEYEAKTPYVACCICGGGDHQSVAPSSSPSSLPSSEPSSQPSKSVAPSDQPSVLPSVSPTELPSSEPSITPTVSMVPSDFPSMHFGATFDGEPCNYDRECKERPLFNAALRKDELCKLLKRRVGTEEPSNSPTSAPSKSSRRLSESDSISGSKRKLKGKSTKAPSSMPSLLPSNAPSALPSGEPSTKPSTAPSTMPSSNPSDSPTSKPSSEPSLLPSSSPSDSPSDKPSTSPSVFPSLEPSFQPSVSQIPSSGPTSNPSSEPSFFPSVSQIPSLEPTPHREAGVCRNKVCVAEDLIVSFCSPKTGIYPTQSPTISTAPTVKSSVCEDSSISASFWGSYGNGKKDGTNDQDFTGGVVVGPSRTVTMFGNAWKAYKLSEPYPVTELTKLEFDFYMFKEAEGHAICVDGDINEDTFGGERIRCFMIGGTQFDSWDHVFKLDITDPTQIIQAQVLNRYDICEAEKRITIDLRNMFLDQLVEINYIAFIQDNDESPTVGESSFENIVLYESAIDNTPQLVEEWVNNSVDCYNHFQGDEKVFQNIEWHNREGSWVLSSTSDGNQIRVYEAYASSLFEICKNGIVSSNSFDTSIADEDGLGGPRRFSISLDGTFAVSYPKHRYVHPSDEPSSIPSSQPSSQPSTDPTNQPTLSSNPSGRRLTETIKSVDIKKVRMENLSSDHYVLRRMKADGTNGDINGAGADYGLDHYGRVVIYFTTEEHSSDWHRNDKFMIYGTDNDEGFGESVAISNDGKVLVVGAPSGGKAYVYKRDEDSNNKWSHRQTLEDQNNFGKKVGVSNDGTWIIVASDNGAFVFFFDTEANKYSTDKSSWGIIPGNSFGQGVAIEIVSNELIVYAKDTSLKLLLSCKDVNASPKSDSNNPLDNVECLCKEGFVSSSTNGVKTLLEGNEFCIPILASSNINATHDSISIVTDIGDIMPSDIELWRLDPDGYVYIGNIISGDQLSFITDEASGQRVLKLTDLRPGYRYKIILSSSISGLTKDLELVAVTSCSCSENTVDDTGRPENFSIYQHLGHVMFRFTDSSYCEDAFSFTRSDKVEEFLLDFAEVADSFVSDFYFSGAEECFTTIDPGKEASDDLSFSNLVVGKKYYYCVRAIGSSHYMDAPFALSTERRLITSSLSACDAHTIEWEASMHGQVTTAKNAGYLPIENVTVRWELLDKDDHTRVLRCDGCSGEVTSDDGGFFQIHIQALDISLDNESSTPVKLYFEKISQGAIYHDFLCNDGETQCPVQGFVTFLNHLTFDAPIHIIDDTSIPFQGKITIADTNGCALSNVEVCAMYNDTSGTEEELVCVESDVEGIFNLPVVIGSTVNRLDFSYKNHVFQPRSTDKDFGAGIVISAEGAPYNDYDFEDVTKAKLHVEVAGGLCNKQLGTSLIKISVAGCDWDPQPITQSGWMKEHWNIPAHVMNVEIQDIRDSSSGSRILPVFMKFQGMNPIVRTIDLSEAEEISRAMIEEEESISPSNTGKEDTESIEEEKNEMKSIEDGEEEQLNTVRFQYDGTLMMDVEIDSSKNKLTCHRNPSDFEDADSFHVIDYMTVFAVNVNLKYEILKGLYCDIVDESLQVEVTSKVGYDDFAGSDAFKASISTGSQTDAGLKRCNPIISKKEGGGICYFEVIHDTDDQNNNIGRARTEMLHLATGRPNIVQPFTKSIIFRVIGADTDVEHKASIFINGLYSKGPGESFALPTHKPIMVLRDPPGGLSTASYENMVTTMRLNIGQDHVSLKNKLSVDIEAEIEYKSFLCKGAGYGIAGFGFNYCDNPLDIDNDVGIFGIESENGGDVLDTTKEESNSFTVTWTFTTSDSPWTAGYSSDVFVTPNLFVAVETVYEVYWNDTESYCAPIFDDIDDQTFPENLVFDLNSPPSEQALSFYTRAHIAGEKIPVMEESLVTQTELLKSVQSGEKVCCPDGKDSCEPDNKEECSDEQIKIIEDEVKALVDGIREWNAALDMGPDKQKLTHWMSVEGFGMEDMHVDDSLMLNGEDSVYSAGIAPGLLIDDAERLDDVQLGNLTSASDEQLKEGIRTAKRLQIAGGGSVYQLTLQKERQDSETKCRNACRFKTDTTISLPALKQFGVKVFSSGVKLSIDPFNINVESEHIWHKQTSTTKATQVTVTLGDPDPGDELVVDMFYDLTYGTLVFETIAGKTKCPQEVNTLPNEDPGIEVLKYPSQYVFPDDEMVFEIKLSNLGVAKESLFTLYTQNLDNEANLELAVDGAPFYDGRVYSNVAKDPESYTQTLTIKRGQQYVNKPIGLSFESACLDADSLINDLSVSLFTGKSWQSTIPNSRGITLFNSVNEYNEPIIKFIEPCPKISWAGLLARDRKFVINTKSSEEERESILAISIFNPDFGKSSLKKMRDDRLKHVFLSYRKLGEGDGDWIPALIDLDTGHEQLDFVGDYADEDNYGYTTLEWFHGGKEGSYELKVETTCSSLGGPDNIDSFRESILSGVIDVTPPAQYGEALPLKNDILLGEEVVIAFTEDLDCSRPFSFEIEVDVVGTNYRFDNDNLHIICEGRKIGFNLDPTQILNPSELLGKTFAVSLGSIDPSLSKNVKDSNGNELVYNIEFQRTFAANQNLGTTSTSFGLRVRMLQGMTCSHQSKAILSETLKGDIASLLDLSDSTRLNITKFYCRDGLGEVDLRMKILPDSSDQKPGIYNRVLGSDSRQSDSPHELLIKLATHWNSKKNQLGGRKLFAMDNFTLKEMKFHPSSKDIETYNTSSENRVKERELYNEISMFHGLPSKLKEDRRLSKELEELKGELVNLREKYTAENHAELSKLEQLENKLKREKEEEMRELKMETRQEMEQLLLLEERLHKLDMSNQMSAMQGLVLSVAMQGLILFVGCMVSAVAMYCFMKRNINKN